MTQPIPSCQIYLLTPPRIDDLDAFVEGFKSVLAAAPIACLQIRLKDHSRDEIIAATTALLPIARAHDCLVLINDDPEIAIETSADGVHLGQSDMNINSAKKLLSGDEFIGVTCHNSKELAFEAATAGADYVAFGAFFDSQTKPGASPADLELLSWWHQAVEIPCVAIGGINQDNAHLIIQAGADFIAVSNAVWQYKDGPAAGAARLHELCAQHAPRSS